MKWIFLALAALVAVVAVSLVATDAVATGETVDVAGQGDSGPPLAVDGANLIRDAGGIRATVVVPTPVPGSYRYPTGDMVPPWTSNHPEVVPGGPGSPEAYTLWLIQFNYPERCTDVCNLDDLDPEAAARGGIYQADGRIAAGKELQMGGSVRIGQVQATGSPLVNPLGAEVHLAIAPHGMALTGEDLQRQLNGPVGNPTLWWAAAFRR